MDRQWNYRRRAGKTLGLILWISLAVISPAWGIADHAEAQVENEAQASEVTYLPLAMRHSGVTERVSVASNGTQGNGDSRGVSISKDGRYLVFESYADNLVEGDTNGQGDVFVHDRQTGETERVSVAGDGTQGNGSSRGGNISGDGRYVVFVSDADNLVEGDTQICISGDFVGSCSDIFVHDRQTGTTVRVSVASDGAQGNSWSAGPSISRDGRYVVFMSYASNLVPQDTVLCFQWPDWVNCPDTFVHDRQTGTTVRVSVASDGKQGNHESYGGTISDDGRYVAFSSEARNLVTGDTNDKGDVFVHDQQTGETELVSIAGDGTPGNGSSGVGSISGDGRYVAFGSDADNLVEGDTQICESLGPSDYEYNCADIFVHDRQTGETERVSVASGGTQGNGDSRGGSISGDGRFVVFSSWASNLVDGDTQQCIFWDPVNCPDIFVHDRQTGTTVRVSVANNGTQGNGWSEGGSISDDGRYVAFGSYATNLVYGDSGDYEDVFVRQWNGRR